MKWLSTKHQDALRQFVDCFTGLIVVAFELRMQREKESALYIPMQSAKVLILNLMVGQELVQCIDDLDARVVQCFHICKF